jgi:hypothetical protein
MAIAESMELEVVEGRPEDNPRAYPQREYMPLLPRGVVQSGRSAVFTSLYRV